MSHDEERNVVGMSRKYHYVLFALLFFLAGCKGKGTEEKIKEFDLSQEVATIDGKSIPLADLNEQLSKNGWVEHSNLKRIKDTAAFNFKVLDDFIIDSLVTQAARSLNIDTVLTAQKKIRDHMRRFVLTILYDKLINERVSITDEDIDTAYNNHKREFFTNAAARAAQILISTSPGYYIEEGHDYDEITKDSIDFLARQRMSNVLEKLEDGESFEELAKEYSDDKASGAKGGALGWIEKDQSPPVFDSTLFALEIGQISPAFKTKYGYHLVKVFERRDSSYAPLDARLSAYLRNALRAQMSKKVSAAFMDSLKDAAKIKYNEKLLKRNDSTYKPFNWLAVIDGIDTIYAAEYLDYARTYQMRRRIAKMDAAAKKDLLNEFSAIHVLDIEARKRGYYDLEETKKELADYTLTEAKRQYRLKGDVGNWSPTDEEIKEFYDTHIEDYYSEKPLHVQHILFQDSTKAEKVRKKIENGADFTEMAIKYYPGDEEIRESHYDLGYISKDEMPIEFWNAAWILSVGDVSRPVKTRYGYHLIKLIDKKPMIPFEHAREKVRQRMIDKREKDVKKAWRDELLAGHIIEIDSSLVREFVYQPVSKMPQTAINKTEEKTPKDSSLSTADSIDSDSVK